jgi:hypothetical protein
MIDAGILTGLPAAAFGIVDWFAIRNPAPGQSTQRIDHVFFASLWRLLQPL